MRNRKTVQCRPVLTKISNRPAMWIAIDESIDRVNNEYSVLHRLITEYNKEYPEDRSYQDLLTQLMKGER